MNSFTIENVLRVLSASLNRIIPFLVLAATAVFIWGIVGYVSSGGDEDRAESARRLIIYGIVGFVVIIAVWGFVHVVIDFIFDTETIPKIPGEDVVNKI